MALSNDLIYRTLKAVTPHVFYLENIDDNDELNNKIPFIVFSVLSKRAIPADNRAHIYKVTYQITLVTKKRNEALVKSFEEILNGAELPHSLISSYQNDDYTLNRVYQVEIITKGGY